MTAETASSAMISTLKAYSMRADEAERIVDKYNEVANNFAIDTEGISNAIERSGASLAAAGNDLSQSLGLIVAANNSVQDPSSVGQMLKTMSMRLRGASVKDLEDLGIDTEGMTQGKKSIVQQFRAMAGIDIMEGSTYKSTFRILDELAEKWADLTDAERAALTEAVGGKRGGSVMSSLMTNWADAREAVRTANESFESASREQENYAKSVQYSIDVAKASLEELATDFMSSNLLKGGLQFFNEIVKVLDVIVEHAGFAFTSLTALGGIELFKNWASISTWFKDVVQSAMRVGDAIKAISSVEVISGGLTPDTISVLAKEVEHLSAAEATRVLSTKKLTAEEKEQILVEAGLVKTRQQVAAQTLKSVVAAKAAESEGKKELLVKAGLIDASTGEVVAINEVTEAKLGDAVASGALTEAEAKEIASAISLTEANTAATGSFSSLVKGIGGAGIAIGAAVVALGALIYAFYEADKANDKFKESARQIGEEYKRTSDEIDDYEEKISELQDKLNDHNTTYEEGKQIREELLKIQDELIEKYGKEAGAVNLVTEAVQGNVEALEELKQKQWEATKREFNKNEGWDWLNNFLHGAEDKIDLMNKTLYAEDGRELVLRFRPDIEDQGLAEKLSKLYENVSFSEDSGLMTIKGTTLQQIYEQALNIDSAVQQQGKSWEDLNSKISDTKDTLDSFSISQDFILNDQIKKTPELSEDYDNFIKLVEKYKELSVDPKGNETAIDGVLKAIRNARKEIEDDLNKPIYFDPELGSFRKFTEAEKQALIDTFDDTVPILQDEFNKWDFEVKVNPTLQKEKIEKDLKTLSEGGNFDLSVRPVVSKEDLTNAGWGENSPLIVSKSNDDNTVAMNFSIVTPDGEVLSPAALETYMTNVLNGIPDNKNLVIGAKFEGEDALGQAYAAVDQIDEVVSEGQSQHVDQIVNDIKQFSSEYELLQMKQANFRAQATEEQQEAFERIYAQAQQAGIDIEHLINTYKDLYQIELPEFDVDALLAKVKDQVVIPAEVEIDEQSLKDSINKLQEINLDDYNAVFSMGNNYWREVFTKVNQVKQETGKTKLTTDEYVNVIQEVLQTWRDVSGEIEDIEEPDFNMTGFAGMISNIKDLQKLYDEFVSNIEGNSIKVPLDISEVESLREKFSSVSSDIFDNFEAIVSNANSTADQCEQAFSNLVTAYIDAELSMEGATRGTVEVVKSQLESVGLLTSSFEAYINEAYIKSQVDQQMVIDGDGFIRIEDEKIIKLQEEAAQFGITNEQIVEYIIEMGKASGLKIDGDDSWLIKLCGDIDTALAKLRELRAASAGYTSITVEGHGNSSGTSRLGSGDYTPSVVANTEATKKGTKANDDYKISFDRVGSSAKNAAKNVGNKGGGAGKSAKDAADSTKEATNELQKLSSELDDIQSAWKRLDDIQKSYAETGKITVDQAQELINTDYRYLAMLNMEGDAMTVNQAAFETLTEAKLNEMKITLIRNAIDLVNTFQDEAVAAEYVANSYLNMGSAAAQATAQVQALQAAVAGLQATGSATQAQAAGLVMQGTMNALSMLNHVDMSSGLGASSGGSVSSERDPEEAADDVEEAIEEQTEEVKNMFNWIDRLLDRLSRRTEKWMNRAERFFTWSKKNAMLNRAIKSGRGEINKTQQAYSYYLAQANASDLDPLYKKKVQKGEVWIDNITSDELAEKIRDYQELWEKIEECKDALDELYARERDLIYQKLDNIVEYFDKIENYYETMAAKFESRINVDEAWGNQRSFTDMLKIYEMGSEAVRRLDDELYVLRTGIDRENVRTTEEIQGDINNKNVSIDNTDLYTRILKQNADLLSDREYFDTLIAKRKELKQAIKDATDKASKIELKKELAELKKEIKDNKVDEKALKAQTNIKEGFSTMLGDSAYYDKAVSQADSLRQKKAENDKIKQQIVAKKEEIANAETNGEKQRLKKELADLKKEQKKTKLTSKENKVLTALENQIAATEKIQGDALVDNAVASSGAYQDLLRKIGNLQNKDSLSPKQEKKLAMYLDELDAINQGVLLDDLGNYINVYERWWELSHKKDLTKGEWIELGHMEKRKQKIEQAFKDEIEKLREEYEDAAMVEGKTPEELTRGFEKEKRELEQSYDKEYDDYKYGYQDSNWYEKKVANYNDTLEWIENYNTDKKWRKKNGYTEEDLQKKLEKAEKLRELIADLERGAIKDNIESFIENWNIVYKFQDDFYKGKLKGDDLKNFIRAKDFIESAYTSKDTYLERISSEKAEAIANLEREFKTRLAETETKQNEVLAEQAQRTKELAELEVSSVQAMIDSLDAIINRYQSIAHLLENTSLDNIKKYNLMNLFGLNDGESLTDLLTNQLTKAVQSSESKISHSMTKINLLQDLVDAADRGGFDEIFAEYLATASEKDAAYINELIDDLNKNVKSTGSWVADWNQQISEATDEIINTVGNIQTLKDEFRENVMFKAVKTAIEQLDQLNSRLNSMSSIIQDNWVMIDGNLTEMGLAKLNLIGQEIGNAQDQVEYWADQIALIDEAWNNDMAQYGSEEEYFKAKNEAVTSYYSAIQGLGNLENQVYQLAKKAQEEEINRLKDLTNARLKNLASKKKLYEYDKNLKNKTKEVELLRSELDALNGINTAEAKARRAQLEASLADAEKAQEELITEHTFDLQEDALQALIENLENTLNDTAKTLKETFEEFADTITNALAKASGADVEASLTKVLGLYMGNKGFTRVPETTGITIPPHPDYDEPIIRNSGNTYIPISQPDYLKSLDANVTDTNLYLGGWQNSLDNIYNLLDNKLSYLNDSQTNNNSNINVTLNYDNLINVTGSVDATVVKDLEKLTNEIISKTKKSLGDDLKKLGVARVQR